MTPQTSLSTRAWIELVLLGLIWGGSFLAIRTALDEIGPLTSVLHRTGWAMLVLWGIVALKGLPLPKRLRIWGAFLVMGLLNNVIPFSLMAWGQLHIPTGLTSIFNAATAIFGIVVAALVFTDEKLTPRKVLGVGLGFGGVCLAIGLDSLRQFDTKSLAQLAILAGTVSYAIAGAWARKMLGGVPPVIAAAGMLSGSTLCMIPLVLLFEGVPTLALAPTTWLAIGYYAIVASPGLSALLPRAGDGREWQPAARDAAHPTCRDHIGGHRAQRDPTPGRIYRVCRACVGPEHHRRAAVATQAHNRLTAPRSTVNPKRRHFGHGTAQ